MARMPHLKQNPLPSDYFSLIKRMLKICGISLNKKEPWLYKIYSAVVLSINLYPFYQLIGAFQYLENGTEVFEWSVFETVTILVLVKSMVLVYNRTFLRNLLDKLQSGMFYPNFERGGQREEDLVRACVTLTNRKTTAYFSLVCVIVVFAFLDAGYSRIRSNDYHDWKFEYSRVTMFNTTYSPNYEIASVYQNLSWVTMGWMFCVSDLLTVTVLAHITCQLRILQNSIRRLMFNSYCRMMKDKALRVISEDDIDASQVPWEYIKPTLKAAIEYHLGIFEIADQVENTFHQLVLIIVLSGIILLGGLLYKPTEVHMGGVMAIVVEISLISYWGNEVSIESQNVVTACYDVNFYGSDLRLQKDLFIMMERSKRPIAFTVGKFSPLTLGTFLWIARTSYSYLMILRRLNN